MGFFSMVIVGGRNTTPYYRAMVTVGGAVKNSHKILKKDQVDGKIKGPITNEE